MTKHMKRQPLKNYWHRLIEMRRVSKNWSDHHYYFYHPHIARNGQEVTFLTVEELYGLVQYVEERKKVDVADATIYVCDSDNQEVLGVLRPHCMEHLEAHLELAVVEGDYKAKICGQSLRHETLPYWW